MKGAKHKEVAANTHTHSIYRKSSFRRPQIGFVDNVTILLGQVEATGGKDLGEEPGSVFPTGQSLQETLHSTWPCSPSLLGNHFLV